MSLCFIKTEELPENGETCQLKTNDKTILVANIDGHFYAVDDTCTHEDASLSLGALHDKTISCPLHGSRFCLLTGAALDAPAELPLRTYMINYEKSGISIS